MKTRKVLGLPLATILIIAMLITPLAALAESGVNTPAPSSAQDEGTSGFTQEGITVSQEGFGIVVQPKDAVGPARYIVQLKEAGLAMYRGNIPGLPATSPAVTGDNQLDASDAASQAYLDYLAVQRAAAIAEADAALGRPLKVDYEYMASFNGYAAEMTPAEAATVARLSGVRRVEREQMFFPDTDAGPEWIGAPGIWDGTTTAGLPGTYGEGVIVGVIDTGIDPWNPSFAATGDDGYTVQNPNGDGNYFGVCDPTNTARRPVLLAMTRPSPATAS